LEQGRLAFGIHRHDGQNSAVFIKEGRRSQFGIGFGAVDAEADDLFLGRDGL
jgi:hypothetical protein